MTDGLTGTLICGVAGNVSGRSNGYAGTLRGYLYGPRGSEIEFLLTLSGTDRAGGERNEHAGAVLGKTRD